MSLENMKDNEIIGSICEFLHMALQFNSIQWVIPALD
jgi:hypothetical protein